MHALSAICQLCINLYKRIRKAYHPPSANTIIKLYFCLRGSCSDFSAGIGKVQIAISDTMLKLALVNQKAIRLMQ